MASSIVIFITCWDIFIILIMQPTDCITCKHKLLKVTASWKSFQWVLYYKIHCCLIFAWYLIKSSLVFRYFDFRHFLIFSRIQYLLLLYKIMYYVCQSQKLIENDGSRNIWTLIKILSNISIVITWIIHHYIIARIFHPKLTLQSC